MSSEKKVIPRLLAAAKEFNIGKETLLDFLKGKNFEVDAKTPNPKLSEEMYDSLQAEFAKDKLAKRKSEEISLPKGSLMETIAKTALEIDTPPLPVKDKNVANIDKGIKKEIPSKTIAQDQQNEEQDIPESLVLGENIEPQIETPIARLERKEETVAIETSEKITTPENIEKKEKVTENENISVSESVVENATPYPEEKIISLEKEEKKPEAKETQKVDEEKKDSPKYDITDFREENASSNKDNEEEKALAQIPTSLQQSEEKNEEEKEQSLAGATRLTGPIVLDKIDLDSINQSTRPKKGVPPPKKRKEEPKKPPLLTPSTPKPQISHSERKKEEQPKPKVESQKNVQQKAMVEKHKLITEVSFDVQPVEEKEHIETRKQVLDGPKVVGKIELPPGTVGGRQEKKEKRKRKRIPVDNKKPSANNRSSTGTGGVRQQNTNDRQQQAGVNNKRRGNDKDNRRKPTTLPNQQQEIDAKEIQERIRETQARLAGGSARSKNLKAKYKRNRREERAERQTENEHIGENKIQVTEFISVSELANLLDVSFADVISKCMSLGIMVSINQRLDAEVIELVASEFDTEVEFISLDEGLDTEEEIEEAEEDLTHRAPVVTIMGHVDHGKTSLLDYIRNASVVAGEAGGITQHIGAYKVTTKDGKAITFLDTPGHEAFTAMRARGAKAADVAIIVVAADDAIMPQTKEAISHAQAAGLPMVFAINKIDKETANPDKIKEQLSAMNILVEDWGGNFQCQEISAKKGINIDLLLEKVLLESEMLELKANPIRPADGLVIEASLDKGRGYVSTILVQGGSLKTGDMVVSGQYFGKIRAMMNERGQRVKEVGPSTPVQILGLNGAPQAGEKFKVYVDEAEAKNVANRRSQILREQGLRSRKHITLDEIGRRLALGNFKELNVIIRADVDGSSEALSDSLQKLSTEEVVVNVVHKGVGQISESDVMLASASDAIIIGFQVRPSAQAAKIAEQENIEIRYYSVIYDAIAEIKSAMEGMLEPTIEKRITGNIEIREIFKISGIGTIAGCYVLDGKFTRNTKINIIRDGIVVHTGELSSLKRFKDDVKEVNAGYECGLSIKNYNDIIVGDIIEGYEEIEVKRKLS